MASSNRASPTWQEILANILRLEESRGFEDRAVVGGLDKFLQQWSAAMKESSADTALIKNLDRKPYAEMAKGERRRWSQRWNIYLEDYSSQNEPPGNEQPQNQPSPKHKNTATHLMQGLSYEYLNLGRG